MAITRYFINIDQKFREILLGFKPLHGTYSSANLSAIVFTLLKKHGIVNRVLAVITDNALNNTTIVENI